MSKKFIFGIRKSKLGLVSVVLTALVSSLGLASSIGADDYSTPVTNTVSYSGVNADGSHYWYQQTTTTYTWESSYSYTSEPSGDNVGADENIDFVYGQDRPVREEVVFDDQIQPSSSDVTSEENIDFVYGEDRPVREEVVFEDNVQPSSSDVTSEENIDFVYGQDRPVREAVVFDDQIQPTMSDVTSEDNIEFVYGEDRPVRERVIFNFDNTNHNQPFDLDEILRLIWGDNRPNIDVISTSDRPTVTVTEPVDTREEVVVPTPIEPTTEVAPAVTEAEPKPIEVPKPVTTNEPVYPLGITLGNNVNTVKDYPVTLNQAQVKSEAMEYLRKLRLDMYNNVNPKFNGMDLRSYLASVGITSAEQYANAFTWDEALERIAIQRALETGVHKQVAHARTNNSPVFSAKDDKTGKGYNGEIIQWGYGMKDSLTKGNAFAYGEVEDLNKADGYSNMANGHLYNLLDPSNKAYGFASISDPNFLYGSVTLGVSSKTAATDTSGGTLNGNYRLAYGLN